MPFPSGWLQQKAKIICTMGPAIAGTRKIVTLIRHGANAFRLNMSHGSYSSHQEYISIIREAEKQLGIYIPIICDLQGPKIRVGDLGGRESMILRTGSEVILADVGTIRSRKLKADDSLIPVTYPTLAKDVKKSDELLLDDGLMKLRVKATDGETVTAVVVNGGILKPRKGLNLPNVSISAPSITSKDRADIRFAIEQQCDYLAVSFVRTAADVDTVRRYLNKYHGDQWVIAKIEKPEALQNIEAIIDVSDAIMVARGDLGVEIPAQNVPIMQKNIIRMCNARAKPVITATQMLESMIHSPRPTRAEASDVANAVLDGTDAVMLSAETSVGAYPTQAVQYMRLICSQAEKELIDEGSLNAKAILHIKPSESNSDSIALAAAKIAAEKRVSGVATLSYSGQTARYISNHRPRPPVIAVTTSVFTARRMGLFWGVCGIVVDPLSGTDETLESIKNHLVREKIFPAGSVVIFTIGRPLVGRARTNMLSIETLSEEGIP